jgi:hypothetical protein
MKMQETKSPILRFAAIFSAILIAFLLWHWFNSGSKLESEVIEAKVNQEIIKKDIARNEAEQKAGIVIIDSLKHVDANVSKAVQAELKEVDHTTKRMHEKVISIFRLSAPEIDSLFSGIETRELQNQR